MEDRQQGVEPQPGTGLALKAAPALHAKPGGAGLRRAWFSGSARNDPATRPARPGSTPPFTASIGIHTALAGEETTVEEIFQRADNALYQAKQDGRNRSFSHAGESGSSST